MHHRCRNRPISSQFLVRSTVALTDCEAAPHGPRVLILRCDDGVELKVNERTSITASDALSQLEKSGWHRSSIVLDQGKVEAAILVSGARYGLFAGGVGNTERLLATCFYEAGDEDGGKQCEALISELLSNGLPPAVAFQGNRLLFIGAKLSVPDGCQAATDRNLIACPEAELAWRDPGERCSGTILEIERTFVGLLQRVGKVSQESLRCTIKGKGATCTLYNIDRTEGGRLSVVARFGGCEESSPQCNIPGDFSGHYPQPCDQVFEQNDGP